MSEKEGVFVVVVLNQVDTNMLNEKVEMSVPYEGGSGGHIS